MVAQSYDQPVDFSDGLVKKIFITPPDCDSVPLNAPPGVLQRSATA